MADVARLTYHELISSSDEKLRALRAAGKQNVAHITEELLLRWRERRCLLLDTDTTPLEDHEHAHLVSPDDYPEPPTHAERLAAVADIERYRRARDGQTPGKHPASTPRRERVAPTRTTPARGLPRGRERRSPACRTSARSAAGAGSRSVGDSDSDPPGSARFLAGRSRS